MQKHTQVYFKYFGYTVADWIGCELCNNTAVDIHHINSRGMGGSKKANEIENLMALCRSCHEKHGDIVEDRAMLQEVHNSKLK